MKTKQEIKQLAEKMFNDIDKPTRSGKDKHSYLVGVQEGYTQCQEDMQKDVEYWQGEFDHWHQQAMEMADVIKQAIEYGYQLRCNNKPINSGIDWVKEFNLLNKKD